LNIEPTLFGLMATSNSEVVARYTPLSPRDGLPPVRMPLVKGTAVFWILKTGAVIVEALRKVVLRLVVLTVLMFNDLLEALNLAMRSLRPKPPLMVKFELTVIKRPVDI